MHHDAGTLLQGVKAITINLQRLYSNRLQTLPDRCLLPFADGVWIFFFPSPISRLRGCHQWAEQLTISEICSVFDPLLCRIKTGRMLSRVVLALWEEGREVISISLGFWPIPIVRRKVNECFYITRFSTNDRAHTVTCSSPAPFCSASTTMFNFMVKRDR